ncbi:MAG: AAA family ATPase [Negativicutes bacterium]|nr:AAA family ATPase [Negativicutes bacterium]
MHLKAITAGIATGLILFFLWQGTDIFPVLFLAGMIAALAYLSNGRLGAKKSFAVFGDGKTRQNLTVFEDIGGQEVAKNELREALEFIRDSETVLRLGIRPLKGILLNGPPGTGKTLLARAAAQFTDSAFVSASGSEFVEMYVGVGAQRVRQLFKQARSLAKKQGKSSAVVFIDEIEVLGGKRGQNAGHLEYDQTLNELLVQMDGLSVDDEVRVLLIGATNRSDMLDPALLRPGRFDRQVRVDLPDKAGRLQILKLHSRNKPLVSTASLEEIAAATFGFSGAHLESLVNEAAIAALRTGESQVTTDHLRGAIDKVIMGEKLDRLPAAAEKRRIAVHEAGHALVSELALPGSVASINVAARGKALGYVRQTQQDDLYLYTADYLRGKITVALAGAVAEEVLLGSRSTGASSDFKQAADMAKQIIFGGMSDLGIVSPDDLPPDILHTSITGVLRDAETEVYALLAANREALEQTIAVLLEQEAISGDEFRQMLRGGAAGICA